MKFTRARAALIVLLFLGSIFEVLLLTVVVGAPGITPDGIDYNYGVFDRLAKTQAIKSEKTDPGRIEPLTDPIIQGLVPVAGARINPTPAYTIENTTQGIPKPSPIFDDLSTSPLPNYASVFDFLVVSGPLSYAVFTNCSGVEHWTNGSLRPTFNLQATGGVLGLVDWERWVEIDCDNDPATGTSGNDLQIRLTPIVQNLSFGIHPTFGSGVPQLNPSLRFFGGVSIEIQRLGSPVRPLPLQVAVLKSFSYEQNNYIWFAKFDFPTLPNLFNASVTADEVEVGGNITDTIASILRGVAGDITNASYLSELHGPYRLGWTFDGAIDRFGIAAGYARYLNTGGTPLLRERTWFEVLLGPARNESAVPSEVLLRLDSESFNKSFDYLQWAADRPAQVSLEYFDERENYTYARALIQDMPTFLEANVDQVGSGEDSTARIHYRADREVASLDYDEYIFLASNASNFIYSHVRLEQIPTEILVNGTLDIGGTVIEPQIRPRQGISLVGEIIDRVMIRVASKLYSIGQTLRAIPNNILNLPDEKGWVSINLPSGGEIGLLEFWLTSGRYALAAGDYVAFYNDTAPLTPPGAVGTSLSGRLQHISCLVAGFVDTDTATELAPCGGARLGGGTTLTLVTSGGLPLDVLFLDSPENATAVAQISNLPTEFTLRISAQSLRYVASSSVASITYTSVIEGQYSRIYLQDLPPYIAFNQTPGDVRIDTLFDEDTGLDGIELFEMQVSDGVPMSLPGDHLLVFQNATLNAVSARVHGIGSLRYVQGAGGHVALAARGGSPFAMVFVNQTTPLQAILHFNPLPSHLEVTLPGSLQSVEPIQMPALGTLSSVLDFSHIIFGIDSFGSSLVGMLSQVGTNLANGIGRFDQDFSFAFDSAANTTLTASIRKGDWSPQDDAAWVHGLKSRQRVSPNDNTSLDLTAKLFLTGLPHHMAFSLKVEAETLFVDATLEDFTPMFDYLAIETDAESVDPHEQPKNIRFFTDGIVPHTTISLKVNFHSDLSIGGDVVGEMSVDATAPLQDFYVRLTTKRPRATAVEVLIPSIPLQMNTRAHLGEGIHIAHDASEIVDFVFVRMSRGIVGPDESAFAIFHNVPTQADIDVPPSSPFEMSAANPMRNLPNITLSTSGPGLDLVADLNGRALGSRGSIRFFASDIGTRLTMLQTGAAYSISSDGVSRLLLELRDFPISRGLSIDATSIYAEDVESLTINQQLVFNAFPIISVDNLNAGRAQIVIEHHINALSGPSKPTTFVFVSIPVGGRGEATVSSNGLVTAPERSGRYIIIPAPVLSYLLSQY
jgi:hypothetical protein